MAELTTGLIENTPVGGIRPTTTFTVKVTNDDTVLANVFIEGFFVTGITKTLYVLESFNMVPGEVAERIYFAEFDEFEFQFTTSSDAVEISAWGKDVAGNLVAAHRLVPAELDPIGPIDTVIEEFAYIYNLAAGVVALEGDILFSDNGEIAGSITHVVGTAPIILGIAGTYAVWFNVAGVEPNQFTLFQNGAAVPGATYGSGAGTQPNPGKVIITAAAGDVLTLRNHTSAAAVTLQTLAGGTVINANASILIEKIS
ncbi:hypothetical protein [Desulfosporosinus fructosivorans]